MDQNDESYSPTRVALCIVLADIVIGGMVFWGMEHQLSGSVVSLCPKMDQFMIQGKHTSILVFIHIVTLAGAVKSPKLQGFLNPFAFIQMIALFGWWTAHTGGLSASIYGPGYLALFPVATIVPQTNWVKALAGTVVAVVAVLMSCYASNWEREIFICVSSIIGCSIGWGIQQFLSVPKANPASPSFKNATHAITK